MDNVFKKLIRGTSFRSGPSSKVVLFKENEDVGHFDEEFRVADSNGVDFKEYKPLESFEEIELTISTNLQSKEPRFSPENISNALETQFNIKKTTPVQKHVIPVLLMDKDVMAVAPTGSGKTLAYLVPILLKLKDNDVNLRCLILVPTVELVQQVKSECVYLTKGKGVKIVALDKTIKTFDFSIAVSTPLTLYKLMIEHPEMLDKLEMLVLDEADKLLEDGYHDNVDYVLNHLKNKDSVQKACFSSTIQPDLLVLAKSYFKNPIHVTIGSDNVCCSNVHQELVCVTSEKGKILTLKQLINEGKLLPPILIFLQTIKRVNELYQELVGSNLKVEKFTKEMNLKERQGVIEKFRTGETEVPASTIYSVNITQIWTLICTDILSRGINFKGVHSVVNFDLPLTSQLYINRVGRAGRGLKKGKSITFFTINDFKYMSHIVEIMKLSNSPIPSYLLTGLSNLSQEDLKKMQHKPPTRLNIGPVKKRRTNKDKSDKKVGSKD
ncbi:RNA helicase [Theileria orientalis]|uniref:ATP-dependent RNA helicase n=1 Tax=Theileria orientalis TaxID=68886 RepID=A0A976SIZ2_THEOR|nr:RNA helicase [Theileria orientalis]